MPNEPTDNREALIHELVAEYSPIVPLPIDKDDRRRLEQLVESVEKIVREIVDEEFRSRNAVENPSPTMPNSTNTTESTTAGTTERLITPDQCHNKLWIRLVREHFKYSDYLSSNHFQAFLLQVQQRLARSFPTANYDDINNAVLDIISDSCRQCQPFGKFAEFPTEGDWRRYFFTAAKRRYIRTVMRKRECNSELDMRELAESSEVERGLLERELALYEIDQLPNTFTQKQKTILKHVLNGWSTEQSSRYSENYIRKVIRKAIKYFQKRR